MGVEVKMLFLCSTLVEKKKFEFCRKKRNKRFANLFKLIKLCFQFFFAEVSLSARDSIEDSMNR